MLGTIIASAAGAVIGIGCIIVGSAIPVIIMIVIGQ